MNIPAFQNFENVNRYIESFFNPLNAELNPICHLLALAGAHHFVHVSRVRVKHYVGHKHCRPARDR